MNSIENDTCLIATVETSTCAELEIPVEKVHEPPMNSIENDKCLLATAETSTCAELEIPVERVHEPRINSIENDTCLVATAETSTCAELEIPVEKVHEPRMNSIENDTCLFATVETSTCSELETQTADDDDEAKVLLINGIEHEPCSIVTVEPSKSTPLELKEKPNASYNPSFTSTVIIRRMTKVRGSTLHRKLLACLYCRGLYRHRISEHLSTKHIDEPEVAKAFAKTGDERRAALDPIRNKGNYKHNLNVLSSGCGELIVGRRSESQEDPGDYLPCIYCLGFFKAKLLWKHCRSCNERPMFPEESMTAIQAKARLLLKSSLLFDGSAEDKKLQPIMVSMMRDAVFQALTGDTLIKRFGIVLFEKLGIRRKNDIAQRMRQLGRLKLAISSNDFQLVSKISGSSFDVIVDGVFALAGRKQNDERIIIFEHPSLALRLGHNLVKCGHIKRGLSLRQDDDASYKEANQFLELQSSEWCDKVSSVALATLRTSKFNKATLLPETADLITLKNYMDLRMDTLILKLKVEPNDAMWRELAELTLAKVVVFNKRRSAETSNLLMTTYKNRGNWKTAANQEILASLTAVEKRLVDRLDIVRSQGKQNKTVATLLTEGMVEAIDLLIHTRSQCRVPEKNPFIFASRGDGPLATWQVLNKVATVAGCQHPERISSTRLRKYLATVVQVINLNSSELHWLASHLGHNVATHKDFYRQHEATLEITKISRLLMAAEAGKLGQYTGKTLQDIKPEDIEIPSDNDNDDGSDNHDESLAEENADVDSIDKVLAAEEQGETYDSSNHSHSSKRKRDSESDESDKEEYIPRKRKATMETDEETVNKSQCKMTKKRWTDDENAAFQKSFKFYIDKRLMPPGPLLTKVVNTTLTSRTVPQVRTKVHNIINKKQKKMWCPETN